MDNNRIAFHFRIREGIACVISPGGFECVDIAAVDLVEGGIVDVIRTTAINPPTAIIGPRNSWFRTRGECCQQGQRGGHCNQESLLWLHGQVQVEVGGLANLRLQLLSVLNPEPKG